MSKGAPLPPKVIRPATSREAWTKMVNAFRLHEGRADKFAFVGKLVGVHRDTAQKAYTQGLGREWSNLPIRDLLIAERAQQAAISVVLTAAKTVPSQGEMTPDQQALAAALGQTEFEKLQAAVRTAVLDEIALVDVTRRCAARGLRASEKLAAFLEARVDAILKKYGPQLAEDGSLTPMEVGPLMDEAKLLELFGRIGHKSATFAHLAIAMERLRIGDPDALRRRLDSVYGGDVGGTGAGSPAGGGGKEEAEGTDSEEETSASPDEVGDVDSWIGLQVVQGGKSPRPSAPVRKVTLDPSPAPEIEEESPASGSGLV